MPTSQIRNRKYRLSLFTISSLLVVFAVYYFGVCPAPYSEIIRDTPSEPATVTASSTALETTPVPTFPEKESLSKKSTHIPLQTLPDWKIARQKLLNRSLAIHLHSDFIEKVNKSLYSDGIQFSERELIEVLKLAQLPEVPITEVYHLFVYILSQTDDIDQSNAYPLLKMVYQLPKVDNEHVCTRFVTHFRQCGFNLNPPPSFCPCCQLHDWFHCTHLREVAFRAGNFTIFLAYNPKEKVHYNNLDASTDETA